MKRAIACLALFCMGTAPIPSTPRLGMAEGRCRPNESGPALVVTATGFKDRAGRLKLELYPPNDADFLADDNILIQQGKVFRRVEAPVPADGPAELCVRLPAPGAYSLSLLHDRDMNRKFSLSLDGIGFPNDPKLGWSKPKAASALVIAGPSITRVRIRLNYRRGLMSFGPVRS